MYNQQLYAKKPDYPASTKKLLAIIIPIISLVVLAGIGVFIFFYYKRFRNEQTRARKLSGTIRLDDTYSSKFTQTNDLSSQSSLFFLVIPQEPPIERNDLSLK